MADRTAPTVVLLRSASGPDDPYRHALAAAGFRAVCIPVLSFRFPHQEALRERLAQPERYSGLIVTSPRAVRAMAEVGLEGPGQTAWSGKRAYAVGPKTADALRELGFVPTGEEAGSAAALASVIAKKKTPYLFLCGNRRRDELPSALQKAGTPFEELVVYETHLRSGIDFPTAEPDDWLVFFSPSGIEAVTRHAGAPARHYRLAAIGPTTAEALRARERTVEAVAERPSPEGLVAALQGKVAGG